MSFQEKTAWVMLVALLMASVLYGNQVVSIYSADMQLPSPTLPSLIGFTVTIVIIAVIGHLIVAVATPKDASATSDERARLITQKAGYIASYVLVTGILTGLGLFLFAGDGDVLFYICFGSLILSHLADYALRILFNRTAFI